MKLRIPLYTLCLAAIAGWPFAAEAAPRPNIVFVMVDDLDVAVWKAALEANEVNRPDGRTDVPILPNIKRFMRTATSFDQLFASQPLCCPSRATLHTGQYPHNHGVVSNDDNALDAPSPYELYKRAREATALGTWMKRAGYRTAHFGKYMNGSGLENETPGEPRYHVPPGWDVWRALVPENSLNPSGKRYTPVNCMYGYALSDSGGPTQTYGDRPQNPAPGQADPDYQTDVLARLAGDYIRTSGPEPFLLIVTPTAPHVEGCVEPNIGPARISTALRYLPPNRVTTPTVELPQPPSYNEADMSDKPAWMQKNLSKPEDTEVRRKLFNDKIASLRPVDDLVGTLVAAVYNAGKSGNTLFIFTSDNGFQYGTHHLDGKEDFYEESARIPMVVKLPRQSTAGTSQAWVLNNDWGVTIANFAGVVPYAGVDPTQTADGRSFKWLAEHPRATGARKTILIRTGPNSEDVVGPPFAQASHRPYLAVRTRSSTLTGDPTGATTLVYAETYNWDGTPLATELYDISPGKDPYQLDNLQGRAEWRDRIAVLKARLDLLKDCSGVVGVNSCAWLEDN